MKRVTCFLCACVCLLLLGCKKEPKETMCTTLPTDSTSTTAAVETTDPATPIEPNYTTFIDENGNIILETAVDTSGIPLQIPAAPIMMNRYFSGWEPEPKQIAAGEYSARYEDVTVKQNAIGFDTVYTNSQQEFVLQIRIEGQTDFAVLSCQLEIPENLQFIKVEQHDGYAMCNYNADSRLLKIALASPENLQSCIELCSVRLAVEAGQAQQIQPILTVTECEKYTDTGNDFEKAEYAVVCGSVHIVQ